ncbi:helix-turn-helix domain-containing protein [Geodermatophilus ruber]|uniref:Zn-dependent peptidase ImmA, M78 family n=1 Tax=Geodermatophilus ruber TaxID=504800 RepID=A0A1I4A6Y7_9ACTN|nr:XRE family transcriptional regulator [Geodermatophilus ruber]SFK52118.1 Zn-dependent peptidase ImmA, M78 family [Geodermatophilus ruber]
MTDEASRTTAARRRRTSGVAVDFDGRRLAVARRLQCMSRSELARRIEVTPSAVTQYERGQSRPTTTVLARIGLVLGMPTEFFSRGLDIPEVQPSTAHFRSLRSTPANRREQALAFGELALAVLEVIEQYVDLPPVRLPSLDLPAHPSEEDIAAAAARARRGLAVAPGPVPDVVRLLEAHGVLVVRLPAEGFDPRVDAFSSSETASGRPLVLMSPLKDDKARSRFDAGHELGHLLMHAGVEPGSKVIESQAMSFAAEFLMPRAEIEQSLPTRVDWAAFHALKRHWGVSLRALVYRAHTLGRLPDPAYRRANQQLKLWGNPEPGPLGPPESPSVLGAAAELLEQSGTPLRSLAEAARIPLASVLEVIAAGRSVKPRLTV